MKNLFAVLTVISITLFSVAAKSQTKFNVQKAGNIFDISIPDYMTRTIGLNDVATVQYKNSVKDIYTIVIEDSKEELTIADIFYTSLQEFQEEFEADFIKDEEKRTSSKPIFTTKNNINFAEYDVSYYDKELKIDVYYLVGIAETKSHFYKILSWTNLENKEKFKTDFQKILYSLKQ
ncbi:MAG: hypothetical protein K2Y30_07135 [Flavobacteriaceae bacterium]|uniref:PsbP C-terminal domain-containing protein n=1 Tax=Flavobacterium kayseriense TaxID=2764714 RepID=A0ABR7J6B0_9FLAO|nr:hypothetical protein [Flavobacterium kayseriense]MBC5841060.1 hypothetical protein [Flavobacterium kayseriense]MBC5847588.1 hypothetical protein [Flavobacterium kayseriense]MBU0940323.1 hypothetical protein [Bacteroidota bacterium]MBX9887693.1 hypothetical protein [Flavobacteriaceae bacterium]